MTKPESKPNSLETLLKDNSKSELVPYFDAIKEIDAPKNSLQNALYYLAINLGHTPKDAAEKTLIQIFSEANKEKNFFYFYNNNGTAQLFLSYKTKANQEKTIEINDQTANGIIKTLKSATDLTEETKAKLDNVRQIIEKSEEGFKEIQDQKLTKEQIKTAVEKENVRHKITGSTKLNLLSLQVETSNIPQKTLLYKPLFILWSIATTIKNPGMATLKQEMDKSKTVLECIEYLRTEIFKKDTQFNLKTKDNKTITKIYWDRENLNWMMQIEGEKEPQKIGLLQSLIEKLNNLKEIGHIENTYSSLRAKKTFQEKISDIAQTVRTGVGDAAKKVQEKAKKAGIKIGDEMQYQQYIWRNTINTCQELWKKNWKENADGSVLGYIKGAAMGTGAILKHLFITTPYRSVKWTSGFIAGFTVYLLYKIIGKRAERTKTGEKGNMASDFENGVDAAKNGLGRIGKFLKSIPLPGGKTALAGLASIPIIGTLLYPKEAGAVAKEAKEKTKKAIKTVTDQFKASQLNEINNAEEMKKVVNKKFDKRTQINFAFNLKSGSEIKIPKRSISNESIIKKALHFLKPANRPFYLPANQQILGKDKFYWEKEYYTGDPKEIIWKSDTSTIHIPKGLILPEGSEIVSK